MVVIVMEPGGCNSNGAGSNVIVMEPGGSIVIVMEPWL